MDHKHIVYYDQILNINKKHKFVATDRDGRIHSYAIKPMTDEPDDWVWLLDGRTMTLPYDVLEYVGMMSEEKLEKIDWRKTLVSC